MAVSYFARYRTGDREGAWTDLCALGDRVRDEPALGDALAVAHETMARARRNVALLIERLHALGYRFAFPDSVWRPPDAASLAVLADLERRYGPFPLSVRTWYEVVGAVDLRGAHPKLGMYSGIDWGGSDRFWGLHWYPDPLVVMPLDPVHSVDDTWFDEAWEEHPGPPFKLFLAPDAIHKSNVSGGEAMAVRLPDPAADAPLLGSDWPGVPFVAYLRECFRWGGFPGLGRSFRWSLRPPDPDQAREELAVLTEGLLPL